MRWAFKLRIERLSCIWLPLNSTFKLSAQLDFSVKLALKSRWAACDCTFGPFSETNRQALFGCRNTLSLQFVPKIGHQILTYVMALFSKQIWDVQHKGTQILDTLFNVSYGFYLYVVPPKFVLKRALVPSWRSGDATDQSRASLQLRKNE